jgi:hypothetical protein
MASWEYNFSQFYRKVIILNQSNLSKNVLCHFDNFPCCQTLNGAHFTLTQPTGSLKLALTLT